MEKYTDLPASVEECAARIERLTHAYDALKDEPASEGIMRAIVKRLGALRLYRALYLSGDLDDVRPVRPLDDEPDGHPHCCVDGFVYLGYVEQDEESGDEVERVEAVPCRRCAELDAERARLDAERNAAHAAELDDVTASSAELFPVEPTLYGDDEARAQ